MYLQSEELVKKLKFAKSGTWGKHAFPVFYKDVLIEYRGDLNSLVLRSFDGRSNHMVTLGSPESKTVTADPEGNNSFCVDPSRIIKSFGKIKSQVYVQINFKDNLLIVKSESTKGQTKGVKVNGFIDMPDYKKAIDLSVPEHFISCLKMCVWSTNTKDTRIACHGVSVKKMKGYIEFCGTDGNIISVSRDEENTENISSNGIIPTESVNVIISAIETGEDTELFMDEKSITVASDDRVIVSRLIDERILAYDAVFDQLTKYELVSIRFNRDQLMNGCKFAQHYANQELRVVRMAVREKQAILVGEEKSIGESGHYKLDCISDFRGNVIFDYQKLIDCISSMESEEVIIELEKENPKAFIIQPSTHQQENKILMTLSNFR